MVAVPSSPPETILDSDALHRLFNALRDIPMVQRISYSLSTGLVYIWVLLTQENEESERRIRVGVVGVRYGSIVHIPGFQSEGVEVVAVCASHHERAEEVANRFDIPHAFTDYDEMLQLDELDAVSIVTPVTLHYSMTM